MNNSYKAIRRTSTPKFIILSFCTLGVFWYVWLWRLITDINKIYPQKYIHRTFWFILLIGINCISIFFHIKGIQTKYIINLAEICWLIVQLCLALQILKNMELYLKSEFDIDVNHNIFGWLFFGCFYINYRINKLPRELKKDLERKISQLKRSNQK